MNKKHKDSIWNQLTPEQTELLHRWLLEQNLTYDQVKTRLLYEWDLTVSTSSICRYYQSLMRDKLNEDFAKVKMALKTTEQAGLDLGGLLNGVLTMMSKKTVDAAMQQGGSKELARLAGLLLQHRQQEIQRGWLELAWAKFQFNSADEVLKLLPLAERFKKEDRELSRARRLEIMVRIFGKKLLSQVVKRPPTDPENPQTLDLETIARWRKEVEEAEKAVAAEEAAEKAAAAEQAAAAQAAETPKPNAQTPEPNESNVAAAQTNGQRPEENVQQPESVVAKPVANASNVTH